MPRGGGEVSLDEKLQGPWMLVRGTGRKGNASDEKRKIFSPYQPSESVKGYGL
jgi:hypothetical protein